MHLLFPLFPDKGISEIPMSKLNKSSKSDTGSKPASSKSSAKEPQKLEVVKIISPSDSPDSKDLKVSEVMDLEAVAEIVPAVILDQKSSPKSSEQPGEASMPPNASTDASADVSTERLQPIPPATESMQYRAIGVVQGRYVAQTESFSKGLLMADDGTIIDAVLLGKVISIAKKRLDLEKSYLWVVYPRTREKTGELHLQIAGVWAPVEMGKSDQPLDPGVEDGYFSIRGEVVYQAADTSTVTVKVQRIEQKKDLDKGRAKFKLHLSGLLPGNPTRQFWDINVQREGNTLVILDAKAIATIARKPARKPARGDGRPQFKGKPTRRPDQYSDSRSDSYLDQSRQSPSGKPVLKPLGERNVPKPSRPVKRANPPMDGE
jgi:hypothetical protein